MHQNARILRYFYFKTWNRQATLTVSFKKLCKRHRAYSCTHYRASSLITCYSWGYDLLLQFFLVFNLRHETLHTSSHTRWPFTQDTDRWLWSKRYVHFEWHFFLLQWQEQLVILSQFFAISLAMIMPPIHIKPLKARTLTIFKRIIISRLFVTS